ncbi:MAG: hypothetical protein CBB68_10660 [Rhodospirillaceae bacterium TMED8]|nr:hypothetical protein [Magnetovibrio sp.]OUT49869.1 MAG: hypothetical protein CBB68_10660 [Rhodospirillaceae bacterium TMED8]
MRSPPAFHLVANRTKKLALVILVIISCLTALYATFWYIIAAQLENYVLRWLDKRPGVAGEFIGVTGFPRALHFSLNNISVNGSIPRKWKLSGFDLDMSVVPWAPRVINYWVKGTSQFTSPATAINRVLKIDIGIGGGVLKLNERNKIQGNFRADGLNIDRHDKKFVSVRAIDIDFAWRGYGVDNNGVSPPFSIAFVAQGVRITDLWRNPRGINWAAIRFRADVEGLLRQGTIYKVLSSWRDAGGVLQITELVAEDGPVVLGGRGTVALDADLQPQAALTLRVEGGTKIIDKLTAAGFLQSVEATAAKILFNVLAKQHARDKSYVEVPLTIQDSVLSAGKYQLMQLPFVEW